MKGILTAKYIFYNTYIQFNTILIQKKVVRQWKYF